ncbi:hypothetical protein [Micromonospora endophytica]|uniref:Uncharacterized protein n=1 Tax=Micromonospora endophytica TaxID=515350 RepID=A0A2W2D5J4_9ACTN|nr:hypothetical protein [Micromonospora endophytica]PZF95809.1 hypothetical protein C1I93_14875 [Micromonospora endophytica]RIW42202.1 hypothetical protein D3H59_23875 [Micromonospora endophytica]BCJ59459.1 hypothetical protein Jiend_28810 [Micromonospora endophytica]
MSYRDWGRGDDGPRERRSAASWADPVEPSPDEQYDSAVERYRTPSRRRAIERGQEEPEESYLPRWALESGVRSVDGGGRHAAPDDDDDEVRPRYAGSWRSTDAVGGRRAADEGTGRGRRAADPEPTRSRRLAESSWRDAAAEPVSDHTREWTFDRPQEEGYVGSRRAEEDDPVSGVAPRSRPRRAQSRQRQVTWSGLEDEGKQSAGSEPAAEAPTRRRRRAAEPVVEPAADPWERAAEPWERGSESSGRGPESRPAVDPWDASGLHVWEQPAGADRRDEASDPWDADSTSQWLQAADAEQWAEPDQTAQWLQPDTTGQWDRHTEADRRDRQRDSSRWDGYSDGDRRERTESPRSSATSGAGQWSWAEPAEPEPAADGFWPGTRLAGDDPRWVDASASAPRSPVVGYTAPRPRASPRRRASPAAPARPIGMAAVRRGIEAVGGSWNRRLEDDLLDPDPGGPWLPLLYTAGCYLLPAVVIFVWLLTLDGTPPTGCVTDISGGGCDSQRARAFGAMVAGMPRFGLALASSLVVAMLLRRVGTTWKSTTIALAAAVVGGGLSTVMISAVTGQPIG